MTMKYLFLFLILLLGILIFYFLGNKYSVLEGLTTNNYTGNNGGSATVYTGQNGNSAGYVVGPGGNVYTGSDISGNTNSTSYDNYNHYTGSSVPTVYYGPNGATAKVVQTNGVYSVIITDGSGNITTYSVNTNTNTTSNTTYNTNTNTGSTTTNTNNGSMTTYYGPNGGTASMVQTNGGGYGIKVTDSYGNTVVYTSNNNQTYNPDYVNNVSYGTVSGYYGGSAGYVTGPQGNTVAYASGPQGNTVATTSPYNNYPNYNPPGYNPPGAVGPYNPPGYNPPGTNAYSSSLPPGIPASQIPPGNEDLYILKSEVVPPVCPACPVSSSECPREKPCPACPPCARCPEPNYDCKLVPNYSRFDNDALPMPVLNDFSTFGM